MTVNMIRLVMLAVFSGMAMNLILQLGIGLKGIAFDTHIGKERLLAGCGIVFAAVMLLWLFFSFVRSFLFLGLFEYVLVFPLSALVFSIFEYLVIRFILIKDTVWSPDEGESIFFNNTLTGGAFAGAALFLALNAADNIVDAAVLSLSFSVSIALVYIVVAEIRRRAEMEAVPRWLRGGPLAFIALGLLSLIFSSGAFMLFTVWGTN